MTCHCSINDCKNNVAEINKNSIEKSLFALTNDYNTIRIYSITKKKNYGKGKYCVLTTHTCTIHAYIHIYVVNG